jgi:outer membrane protein OmpA-like peptidoglycan-associated protein
MHGPRRVKQRDEAAFWVSYSDLATSLMLVFVLIVCITNVRMKETLGQQQEQLENVEGEVRQLLSRREVLSERLLQAVEDSNKAVGREVFRFEHGEVFVSDSDVAWFLPNRAELTAEGRKEVTAFYRNLYASLLGDGTSLPDFLGAIDIQGHTDPLPRHGEGDLWTWESYNGTARRGHADGNLWLSQQRAKAILDHIQDAYAEGAIDATRFPWRPFAAIARVSGRSWTRAFCTDAAGETPSPINPDALLSDSPCPSTPLGSNAALNRASRRVTFSFDLDDKEILERIQEVLDTTATEEGG